MAFTGVGDDLLKGGSRDLCPRFFNLRYHPARHDIFSYGVRVEACS